MKEKHKKTLQLLSVNFDKGNFYLFIGTLLHCNRVFPSTVQVIVILLSDREINQILYALERPRYYALIR